MEEKERYVYHEVSNEVEAYECYWDNQECCELFDDKAVLNRLNEQDYELKKLNQENIKLIKENQQLKQQLAEKQKEIEEVKKSKTYIMNFGSKVKEVQVVDDNQDKILFAVEQLEKVKEFVNEIYGEYSASVTTNFIDNQIEGLKKDMK